MGWTTVLYIAFGLVALWLLGEVLLQYKARLRWRILAFCGFLGVVVGVLLASTVVIIAGAVAFAVGQTFVTLSFRRGFSTGWAIGGNPGASRRRKAGRAVDAGPTLEVSGLSYEDSAAAHAPGPDADELRAGAEQPSVYEPQPLPEDTGQYGVYGGGQPDRTEQAPAYGGYDTGAYDPGAYGTAAYGSTDGYDGAGHDSGGYAPAGTPAPAYDTYAAGYEQQQPGYEQQPGYDYGASGAPQQYAAYSDPYIGPGTDGQQYTSYYGDSYAAPSYSYDTPPGGVWVPQQRDTDEQPPQAHAPGQYGYEQHPDEQSRYRY
ncbi:hypothetical protein ACF1BN_10965 [Streptomyces sp. NPDC014861]|uniref:hypothetical protein n=1 Tax=Streptomyces sp. NPDC014861 TaxID=3364923 RepID=UPI0036FCB5D5